MIGSATFTGFSGAFNEKNRNTIVLDMVISQRLRVAGFVQLPAVVLSNI